MGKLVGKEISVININHQIYSNERIDNNTAAELFVDFFYAEDIYKYFRNNHSITCISTILNNITKIISDENSGDKITISLRLRQS